MKLTIISVAVASSLFATAIVAAEPRGIGAGGRRGALGTASFELLDANKDGKVTREEARQASAARFDALDGNKDGVVVPEEFQAMRDKRHEEMIEKHFAAEDTNKDGRLSRDETRMRPQRFERVDTNQDGYLTKAELVAARPDSGRGRPGWKSGAPHQGERDGDAAMAQGRARRRGDGFGWLGDLNRDGKLSRDEALKAADSMFERADVDRNGSISAEELGAAHPGGRLGKRAPARPSASPEGRQRSTK